MFFIIPIGSEEGVRRLPYLTLGIIILNTVIWIFTSMIVAGQEKELVKLDSALRDIEYRYIYKIVETDPKLLLTNDYNEIRDKFEAGEIMLPDDPDFEKWTNLYVEFKNKLGNTVFEKYGFKPRRFNILQIFSSLFIHANFLHLLFNMLFLWLVGCNIEDDWSWKIFGGLYLVSGFVACVFHAVVFPASNVPLIGASGAIAGVMGAFMIRHFKTKIWFAYFVWFFIRPYFGRFRMYAGIWLPFWFLQQYLEARWSTTSGVAYWAHIGGFILGAVIGLSFRFLGIEKKYIEPMVEDSFEKLKLSPTMKEAYKKLENGDAVSAIPLFLQALNDEPQNVDARLVLARIYMEKGRLDEAGSMYDNALGIVLRVNDFQLILSIKDEAQEKSLLPRISEKNLYNLGTILENRARYDDAVKIYAVHLSAFSQSNVRPKILHKTYLLYKDKLNKSEVARKVFSQLQKEYPDFAARIAP